MTRADHAVIADMVTQGARVLDVGCGDGTLLRLLAQEKGARARGMEISQAGVNACVASGLSVVQGDADRDLAFFPDQSFDFVILSKTIQAVRHPRLVMAELMRIGARAIVSISNFGHWRARAAFTLRGRMPVTGALPLAWFESDAIHPCTVHDFADLASQLGLKIERAVPIIAGEPGPPFARNRWQANLFAEDVVFLLGR
jgi:methionine biosynthesis protein MetW